MPDQAQINQLNEAIHTAEILDEEDDRLEESTAAWKAAVELSQGIYSGQHSTTLYAMQGYAECLSDADQWGEALPLWQTCVQWSDVLLSGNEREMTQESCARELARCLSGLQRWEEALPYWERCLRLSEVLFANDKRDLTEARCLQGLAKCLSALRRWSEAEAIWLRAAEMTDKRLGRKHKTTFVNYFGLAKAMSARQREGDREAGRFKFRKELHSYWQICLRLCEQLYDSKDPSYLLTCLEGMARAKQSRRWYRSAIPFWQRALDICEKFRRDERQTQRIRSNLEYCRKKAAEETETVVPRTDAAKPGQKTGPTSVVSRHGAVNLRQARA